MRRAFAVYEAEYPDEGSNLVVAWSEKGARRKYRRMTGERAAGVDALIPLEACPLTTHQALALWRAA